MCKTKMAVNVAQPKSSPPTPSPRSTRPTAFTSVSSSYPSEPSTSTGKFFSSTSYVSTRTSLSSLRESLPENPHIYDFSEICSATNNFLANRQWSSSSSSTPSWRCTLRGKDSIVFQRKFRRKIEASQLKELLSVICRSHHGSIVKLFGASVSGEHIYPVYEFVTGANLADCLRNSRSPNFTVLSTWIARMQIATDLAHGLDYIHNNAGLNSKFAHNHITSSSIIVTEPSFNARLCHYGAAQLCGEAGENERTEMASISDCHEEINGDSKNAPARKPVMNRFHYREMQFEGVRGYMSPEFQSTGVSTQMSDIYAFGVVILELLSGEEPMKYEFDKNGGNFIRTSIIDTAKVAINEIEDGEKPANEASAVVHERLRRWVDRRLKDSFPVDVAAKLTRLALECVNVDPTKRPNMTRVTGKISKLYLESGIWSESMKFPSSISVSLAPR